MWPHCILLLSPSQEKDTYGENPAVLSDKYLDKAEKR